MYIDLITIDLCPGQGGGVNPSGTLEITGNGEYDVYSYASASVDVHPSASLSETYISNGSYSISGEFNGGTVNVDVHPSVSLSETYTSNGSYNITGEFNGGLITIEVPAPQFITETLSVSVNNTYYPGSGVNGFSEVVVNVPQSVTGFTEKDVTEGNIIIQNLFNSASYVAKNAFGNNSTLQTVNLPDCTVVNDGAFSVCNHLTTVSLPNCKTIWGNAFQGCSILQDVSLPVCKSIANSAFRSCYNLTSIYLPECKTINLYVFADCINLQEVSLPVCTSVGNSAFRNCYNLTSIYLPECKTIAGYAFQSCSSLSIIDLPNVIKLDTSAFTGMSNITNVSLPKCESIGGLVMEGCRSITELDLPYLYYISGAAFNQCTGITTIKVPALVQAISWYGNGAFLGCEGLSQLYIGLDQLGVVPYSLLFNNMQASTPLMQGIGSIYINEENYDSYTIASGWSSLSSLMVSVHYSEPLLSFSNGLIYGINTYITAGWPYSLGISANDVTEINLDCYKISGMGTFSGCYSLSKVTLNKCIAISLNAFLSCKSLGEVYLGKCEYIGNNVFIFANISSITIATSSVCSIESDTFYAAFVRGNYSIYVPSSLVSDYQIANYWSSYSSHIYPISE